MCEGSIYVPHRQATDKEQLTIQGIPGLRMKGTTLPQRALNQSVGLHPQHR